MSQTSALPASSPRLPRLPQAPAPTLAAGPAAAAPRTPMQRDVDFFDRNHDGRLTRGETQEGDEGTRFEQVAQERAASPKKLP